MLSRLRVSPSQAAGMPWAFRMDRAKQPVVWMLSSRSKQRTVTASNWYFWTIRSTAP